MGVGRAGRLSGDKYENTEEHAGPGGVTVCVWHLCGMVWLPDAYVCTGLY